MQGPTIQALAFLPVLVWSLVRSVRSRQVEKGTCQTSTKPVTEVLLNTSVLILATAATFLGSVPARAESHRQDMPVTVSNSPMTGRSDAAKGRMLFASKGCVVCHSVNGVGGEDAPPLDAEFMDLPMNAAEFAARMWAGAEAMVELQRDEFGDVVNLNGAELAAIIAFAHDADEQAKFSTADIPDKVGKMMDHMEQEGAHDDMQDDHD